MKPGMPHRAKVFCVNWGHAAPVTRHIVQVYDKHDRLVASPHFGTLASHARRHRLTATQATTYQKGSSRELHRLPSPQSATC